MNEKPTTQRQGIEMIGMKDWLQRRAEELALTEYNMDFHELIQEQRDRIYNAAINDYKDYMADRIDNARVLEKYK